MNADIAYIQDDAFDKVLGPALNKIPYKLISWVKLDKNTNTRKTININSLMYHANIMKAALDTLAEFSIGPSYENQLAVKDSGNTI